MPESLRPFHDFLGVEFTGWGYPGQSTFDWWSLQHVVWFFFIFAVCNKLSRTRKHAFILFVISIVLWEIFEATKAYYGGWIPTIGTAYPESLNNKLLGDTVSDFVGALLFILLERKKDGSS